MGNSFGSMVGVNSRHLHGIQDCTYSISFFLPNIILLENKVIIFLYGFKILYEDQEDLEDRYQSNLQRDAHNSSVRGSSIGHRHSTKDIHPRTTHSYTPPAVEANGPVRVSVPPSYPSRPYSAANYQDVSPIGAGGTPVRIFVTGSGGGSVGAEGTARALLDRNRIGRQSLPPNRRRQPSALERDEAEKIAALGGEEADVAKTRAESLVSAKSETPSATKPKSNDVELNADAGGTDKRAAGALVATTAPRDSIATSSVGPESKAAKVVDSSASQFPLPVRPPALARDINEYSKWSTLEEFGYEFKGIQLLSVLVSLSLSLSVFTLGFHSCHTKYLSLVR